MKLLILTCLAVTISQLRDYVIIIISYCYCYAYLYLCKGHEINSPTEYSWSFYIYTKEIHEYNADNMLALLISVVL